VGPPVVERPPQGGQDAIAPGPHDRARFARCVMPGWRRTSSTAGGRAIPAATLPNASPRETPKRLRFLLRRIRWY